jgi:hypothetical protein
MAGFTEGLEVFVIHDQGGEGHTLLFLPYSNNDELQRERKAPVGYTVPKKMRLARNLAPHTYKFSRIRCVGVFDEVTAGTNNADALGGSRSAWAPVIHGRDFRGTQIDARAWRRQDKSPCSIAGGVTGSIPSEIVRGSFNGIYSPFFKKPLLGREGEGGHGRSTKR